MAWGHKNRKGARQGSKSEQFKKGRRGGQTIDGRCATCGGVEGRHNMIRRSQPVYDKNRAPTGRYKIVTERCPNG
jgi:hypothetical protein